MTFESPKHRKTSITPIYLVTPPPPPPSPFHNKILITNPMNKTFKEVHKEEQELENTLASVWGYNMHSNIADPKHKKHKQKHMPSVASITLRQFATEIPKTERIQQVEDSIKAQQNERKLMQEHEKAMAAAANGEVDSLTQNKIMQWMEDIVSDYNSIVEHRHLTKQGHPKELSQLAPSRSQQLTEDIIAKIVAQKKLLQKADLKTQIKVNRHIAALYREFHGHDRKKANSIQANNRTVGGSLDQTFLPMKKMRSNRSIQEAPPPPRNLFLSMRENNSSSDHQLAEVHKGQSLRENELQSDRQRDRERDRPTNAIKKYKESEYKKQYSKNMRVEAPTSDVSRELRVSSLGRQEERGKLEREFLAPYGDKQGLNLYRDIQTKIRSNKEAMEIWKGKVHEVTSKSARTKRKRKETPKLSQTHDHPEPSPEQKHTEKKEEEASGVYEQNRDIFEFQEDYTDPARILDSRSHEQEKEDIFSQLLKKRNNKFNKLLGTKTLVKYDARKEAQMILRGEPEKVKSVLDQLPHRSLHQRHSKIPHQALLPQEQANLKVWLEECNDRVHYDRTCKNEKINLLLKRR